VVFGLIEECALHVSQQAADFVDRFAQPQTQIGRDLVVARTGGMQALSRLPRGQ